LRNGLSIGLCKNLGFLGRASDGFKIFKHEFKVNYNYFKIFAAADFEFALRSIAVAMQQR